MGENTQKNEIKFAVFDKRQSVADSIYKDVTSLAVLCLMVYVSRGSSWWTLVTGLMFIAWMTVRVSLITKERYKTFKTTEELRAWVDSLEEGTHRIHKPVPEAGSRPGMARHCVTHHHACDCRERAFLEALALAQDTMEAHATGADLEEWHGRVESLIGTTYPRNICGMNAEVNCKVDTQS